MKLLLLEVIISVHMANKYIAIDKKSNNNTITYTLWIYSHD